MARENNFLLGHGERLTNPEKIKGGGGSKEPPYSFREAVVFMKDMVESAMHDISALPKDACPNNYVSAAITMHPRFISKSDFPSGLLEAFGLFPVGGKAKTITPREWGTKQNRTEALTDEIIVIGQAASIATIPRVMDTFIDGDPKAVQLATIEGFHLCNALERIKASDYPEHTFLSEIVLYDFGGISLEGLVEFSRVRGIEVVAQRAKQINGLTFVPAYTSGAQLNELAQYSMIRAVRMMPIMRPIDNVLRGFDGFAVNVNPVSPAEAVSRVAIFDGGLPDNHGLEKCVKYIEPAGIGPAVKAYQEHGLAVTSALLFGPLTNDGAERRPVSKVDHIRVLDSATGANGDFEYYDVLDRIINVLDAPGEKYDFVNLSIGPNVSIDDDDITRWTADLDARLSRGDILTTVAAGNSGTCDPLLGLNRIQPPSDSVNALSVGACDSEELVWERTKYSSVGPGRLPGLIKPDVVAFGGTSDNPFYVLSGNTPYTAIGIQGTSFAAPYALHSALGVRAKLGNEIDPLVLRALLVHQADPSDNCRTEIGWGRILAESDHLMTCDDNEAQIIFQGELPAKEHLRVPIPIPTTGLSGMIELKATLVISTDVDPNFPNAYTRSGLEVVFRPNSVKRSINKVTGAESSAAPSVSFFSACDNYHAPEFKLRNEGHKWETCWKGQKNVRASSLVKPLFHIYHHTRDEGQGATEHKPVRYALIIGIRSKTDTQLYQKVFVANANILIPLRPQARIEIRN